MTETILPTNYIRSVTGPRDETLDKILRQSLLEDRMPPIQVDDNSGRVLQLLTEIHAPRDVLEIGALFGYSTIYIARGLAEGGTVTSLEIDDRAAEIARRNLNAAGLSDRANIVCGDATEYLTGLMPESLDMVFIDGAKRDYPTYLKHAFKALRRGGLLIADDVFAQGDFSEGRNDIENEEELKGIRTYNQFAVRSPKMFSAFIGTTHGLLVSRKNG